MPGLVTSQLPAAGSSGLTGAEDSARHCCRRDLEKSCFFPLNFCSNCFFSSFLYYQQIMKNGFSPSIDAIGNILMAPLIFFSLQ